MDLSRYLGLFVSDSREHLAQVESELVRYEEATDPAERLELLHGIFRHLHSLKGSAATMGFEPVAQLTHRSEELIDDARQQRRALTAEGIDLLLQASDALRVLVDAAAEGRTLVAPAELVERLSSAHTPAPVEAVGPRADLLAGVEGPVTLADIRIAARSATPAARAFLVLRKLASLGEVLRSDPPLAEVRGGHLPGNLLRVVIRGEHALQALQDAVARVPDIEAIEPVSAAAPARAPVLPTVLTNPLPVAEQTVRVNADLLDQLLEMAGELVLTSAPLEEESDRLRRLVKDLNNRVLATRQTPIQRLAERLPRVVRDLSRRLGKPISLRTEGVDVTLDRGLLEALGDPVSHALRNAADHGIESVETRTRLGKPPGGQITFAARRERDRVIVELQDDGRGFDNQALRDKAVRAGALSRAEADALSDDAALRLAFLPGVSTRDVSSDVSGRGVGMDAVLRAIEQLGGTVVLQSVPGRGSCVRFVLPTTVSVMNLLLVDIAGEIFGLPMSRVLLATEASLPADGPARQLAIGADRVPAYALGRLVGLPEALGAGMRPFIVVDGEGGKAAVGVDRILGQEEVVLRPLSPPLERIRGLSGTAILGSGRPIFVLDVPRLVA
jgi:two-component system chemotaxis sensor kinase CheA